MQPVFGARRSLDDLSWLRPQVAAAFQWPPCRHPEPQAEEPLACSLASTTRSDLVGCDLGVRDSRAPATNTQSPRGARRTLRQTASVPAVCTVASVTVVIVRSELKAQSSHGVPCPRFDPPPSQVGFPSLFRSNATASCGARRESDHRLPALPMHNHQSEGGRGDATFPGAHASPRPEASPRGRRVAAPDSQLIRCLSLPRHHAPSAGVPRSPGYGSGGLFLPASAVAPSPVMPDDDLIKPRDASVSTARRSKTSISRGSKMS